MEIHSFVDFNTKTWQETRRLLKDYDCYGYREAVQLIKGLQHLNWGTPVCSGLTKPRFDPSEFMTIFLWAKAHILNLPKHFPKGLSAYRNSFDLSKLQCVAILSALVFACTSMQHTFFHEREKEKLDCILSYFRIMMRLSDSELQSEHLGIEVNQMSDKFRIEKWLANPNPLLDFEVDPTGKIEDYDERYLKVDFANEYIGGGVLNFGCVQEEILFSIYPELMVSMFFCRKMKSNEAISIKGARRVANYSGYAWGFKFVSQHPQGSVPKDDKGRICNHFVAIDALMCANIDEQFSPRGLLRELNKAFIGFKKCRLDSEDPLQPVVTGRWGCGEFGGFAPLKVLIQWMAASEAGRKIIITTFRDETLSALGDIMERYKGKPIGELLTIISGNPGYYLFDSLLGANVIKKVPVEINQNLKIAKRKRKIKATKHLKKKHLPKIQDKI